MITICHHLASLVMPNRDLWDGFFDPTLTFMMDSYIVDLGKTKISLTMKGRAYFFIFMSRAVLTISSRYIEWKPFFLYIEVCKY